MSNYSRHNKPQRGGKGGGGGGGDDGRWNWNVSSFFGSSSFNSPSTRSRAQKPIVDAATIPSWEATCAKLKSGEKKKKQSSEDELEEQQPQQQQQQQQQQSDEEMDDDLKKAIAMSLADASQQPSPRPQTKSPQKRMFDHSNDEDDEDKSLSERVRRQIHYPVNSAINSKIKLYQGDITRLKVDAVVNAANSGLWAGGGICGAIFSAAGEWKLEKQCKKIIEIAGEVPPGECRLTRGFDLPAPYIIHTVGPMDGDSGDLMSAYRSTYDAMLNPQLFDISASKKADPVSIRTLAMCCISTGIYGFESDVAAKIALRTTRDWLEEHSAQLDQIDSIIFCVFMQKDMDLYEQLMPLFFPVEETKDVRTDQGQLMAERAVQWMQQPMQKKVMKKKGKKWNSSKLPEMISISSDDEDTRSVGSKGSKGSKHGGGGAASSSSSSSYASASSSSHVPTQAYKPPKPGEKSKATIMREKLAREKAEQKKQGMKQDSDEEGEIIEDSKMSDSSPQPVVTPSSHDIQRERIAQAAMQRTSMQRTSAAAAAATASSNHPRSAKSRSPSKLKSTSPPVSSLGTLTGGANVISHYFQPQQQQQHPQQEDESMTSPTWMKETQMQQAENIEAPLAAAPSSGGKPTASSRKSAQAKARESKSNQQQEQDEKKQITSEQQNQL